MKKIILIMLVLTSLNLQSVENKSQLKKFKEAQKALEEQDYKQAIDLYNTVIESDSKNLQARYQRGIAYFYSSMYDLAVTDFDYVVKKNTSFPDGWNFLGLAKSYMGDLEGAMECFSKAIKLDPKFAEALLNRGSGYLQKQEYDKALSDFNKAVKLSPKNPEIYLNRGNAYKGKGDLNSAEKDYLKTIEYGIKNKEIYYRLGNLYFQLSKYSAAVDAYTNALKFDENNKDALNNRAVALDKAGRILEAEIDRKKLQELDKPKAKPMDNVNLIEKTDTPKMISIKIPETWYFIEKPGVIYISDNTEENSSERTIIGTITLMLDIADSLKFNSPQELITWWDQKQAKSGDNYLHYYYRSKKDKPYRGEFPQKFTKAQLQFTEDGEVFLSYDMAIAYNKHLLHVNFQFPEKEYIYYDALVDKILSSVALTFAP